MAAAVTISWVESIKLSSAVSQHHQAPPTPPSSMGRVERNGYLGLEIGRRTTLDEESCSSEKASGWKRGYPEDACLVPAQDKDEEA
jgi:hypothetical protein